MKSLLALVSVVFILGCAAALAVEKGDHVSVEYTGMLENGTIFDSSAGRAALEFDAGAGQMIKGFDDAVIGMRKGDEKNVTIRPEDAYGMPDPKNIIEVPLANLPNGTKAGDTLYAGGQPVRVVEIRNSTAVIDTNHFLAGKTLIFRIKIVDIVKPGPK